MMHITGGAYSKLKPLLQSADAHIFNSHSLNPQEIFFELYKKGVSDEEMYKTFNSGIGFIIGISEKDVDVVLSKAKTFNAEVIGKVLPGSGKIMIDSKFSKKRITY
jgi:phosphoribosylformylglycinamidine cyclo-ligase